MKKTKQILLVLLLAAATGSTALAQAEKTSGAQPPMKITFEMLVANHNFPVKQNTGNPELDQQKYAAAKKKWIAENAALYKKYNEQSAPATSNRNRAARPVVKQSN